MFIVADLVSLKTTDQYLRCFPMEYSLGYNFGIRNTPAGPFITVCWAYRVDGVYIWKVFLSWHFEA